MEEQWELLKEHIESQIENCQENDNEEALQAFSDILHYMYELES